MSPDEITKLARDFIHDAILDCAEDRMALSEQIDEDTWEAMSKHARETLIDQIAAAIRREGRDFLDADE